ncbi:LptE family protein [Lacibacter sediminis]|uniref:LptE family protein n=1 Tax=Lacibacter sediminis TaxID=2760713 RepID=A0A7G5XBB8_9BACT|nr:LptE family protein [Lacibacter sediminis]QNA42771.1 LptE family protein [Lacibacter sediminis]
MILKNSDKNPKYKVQSTKYGTPQLVKLYKLATISYIVLLTSYLLSSCYSFKDVSIPPEVKTVKVNYIENRARIVNPNLSQRLTDKLRQKIVNQTRLSQTNSDDAHYDISGQITDYYVTTSGISNQQAASNRLNVTVHLVFKNRLDDKKNFEADLTRNFDFSASKSLSAAEAELTDLIVQNMTDEIFNRIFSNW